MRLRRFLLLLACLAALPAQAVELVKWERIPLPVALTCYAAQSLYAPSRTIEPLPGVHSVSLPLPDKLTSLLSSESVEIKPLAAWGLQGYSVVALAILLRKLRPRVGYVQMMFPLSFLRSSIFTANHYGQRQSGVIGK